MAVSELILRYKPTIHHTLCGSSVCVCDRDHFFSVDGGRFVHPVSPRGTSGQNPVHGPQWGPAELTH